MNFFNWLLAELLLTGQCFVFSYTKVVAKGMKKAEMILKVKFHTSPISVSKCVRPLGILPNTTIVWPSSAKIVIKSIC